MKLIVSQLLFGAAVALTAQDLSLSQFDFEESYSERRALSAGHTECPYAAKAEFVYFNVDVGIKPDADATGTCSTEDLMGAGIGGMINQAISEAGVTVEGDGESSADNHVGSFFGGTCPKPVGGSEHEKSLMDAQADMFFANGGLRRKLGYGFVWRGGGGCSFCPPDDDDDRRRLQQLESLDYSPVNEFEDDVKPFAEETIESYLQANAFQYSCLGSSPTIIVVIQPVYYWDLDVSCIDAFDDESGF